MNFTGIGDKQAGLDALFKKMAAGDLKTPVLNDSHVKIEGDVFSTLATAAKQRMTSDTDVVIKSNSEVTRDTWLNDITVAADLLAKLAPIAAPVAGAAVLAGLTELGLGAEKAASGDTEAERSDGVSKAFYGLLNTLFSARASAVPEDPFALPPEKELPTVDPLVTPEINDIEEPTPGPSSGVRFVNEPGAPLPKSQSLLPMAPHAVRDGEQLIKNATRDAQGVYRMTDSTGTFRQFVRFTDETSTSRVFEISGRYRSGDAFARIINPDNGAGLMVITPGREGEWTRAPGDGGLWWKRAPALQTSTEKLTSRFADNFANEELDELAKEQSKRLDDVFNVDEATHYESWTSGFEENGVVRRKLNTSWSTPMENFELLESERAVTTPLGTSKYANQFILDVNRLDYTVVKSSKSGEVFFDLKAGGESTEAMQRNRVKQFEEAIPDPYLRARISEVAHQGAMGPANIGLAKTAKEGLSPKMTSTHFYIEHDPLKNEAHVNVVAKWDLKDLRGDEMLLVPEVEMTSTREFIIRLGNDVLDNPYIIEEVAPTRLTASVLGDSPATP